MSNKQIQITAIWKDKSISNIERQRMIQEILSAKTCNDRTCSPTLVKRTPPCSHYQRKCSIVAECCGKEYGCRLCHDDESDHAINRFITSKIRCHACDLIQPVTKYSQYYENKKCMIRFSDYYCFS